MRHEYALEREARMSQYGNGRKSFKVLQSEWSAGSVKKKLFASESFTLFVRCKAEELNPCPNPQRDSNIDHGRSVGFACGSLCLGELALPLQRPVL